MLPPNTKSLSCLVAAALLAQLSACSFHKQDKGFVSENSTVVSYLLSDPKTGDPLPDTPYRLVFNNRTIIAFPAFTEKVSAGVIHGQTDHRGYTREITVTRSENEDHELLRRIGTGHFGLYFKIQDEITHSPVRKIYYTVTLCDGNMWDGYSDDRGNTAYFSSEAPCEISLYMDQTEVDVAETSIPAPGSGELVEPRQENMRQ